MTEITPVPESLRKAYCEKFGLYLQPMTASRPPYEYDNWKRQEDILQFIAAYGLECEREGYVKGTDAVWGMIPAQRESAVREVIEEFEKTSFSMPITTAASLCCTTCGFSNDHQACMCATNKAIKLVAKILRNKFLPTSLTPEK